MRDALRRHRLRLREAEWSGFRTRLQDRIDRRTWERDVTVRRWLVSSSLAGVMVIAIVVMIGVAEHSETIQRRRPMVLVPAPGVVTQTGAPRLAAPSREFTSAREDSASQPPLAIGTGSFERARARILAGSLPDPDSVRPEEFANFFSQGYPEFESPDIRLFFDGAPSPWRGGVVLVRVGIAARGAREQPGAPGAASGAAPLAARGAPADANPQWTARNVHAEVVFDPRSVESYRLVGFEHIAPGTGAASKAAAAKDEDRERSGTLSGATLRPGQTVALLYEIRLLPRSRTPRLGAIRVTYEIAAGSGPAFPGRQSRNILRAELAEEFQSAPSSFQVDALAAEFGQILRDAGRDAGARLAGLVPLTRALAGHAGGDPDTGALASLVEMCAGMLAEGGRTGS